MYSTLSRDRSSAVPSLGGIAAPLKVVSQDVSSDERGLALVLAWYTALIPLGVFLYIDVNTRGHILTYRQVIIVGVIVAASLIRYRHGPATSARRLALVYAAWYAAVAVSTDRFFVGVFVVYLFWAVVVFNLMPMLGSRGMLAAYLRTTVWAGVAILTVSTALWISAGGELGAQNLGRVRWSVGFENPNILSGSIQLVVVAAVWRYCLGHSGILPVALLGSVGTFVVYQAQSSNYFLFWVGFIGSYWLLTKVSLRRLFAVIFSLGVSLVVVLVWTGATDQLNGFTDGRLVLWQQTISSQYRGDLFESFYVTFTGTQSTFVAFSNAYGEAVSGFSSQRIGTDNTYLGTFIETGAVGLGLFIGAWAVFLRPVAGAADSSLKRLVGATAVGFALQSAVLSSIPSFGNAVTLGVCSILALGVGEAVGGSQGPDKSWRFGADQSDGQWHSVAANMHAWQHQTNPQIPKAGTG